MKVIYVSAHEIGTMRNTALSETDTVEYVIRTDIDLPDYIKNINPAIPLHEYIAMLLKKNHQFRLPDGTRLRYNGYDKKGHILLSTPDGKTKRLWATLEVKFFLALKALYTLALYLTTPTP